MTSQKDDAKNMAADHKWHHIFPLEACSGLMMGAKIGTAVTLFHNVLYPKNKTMVIPVTSMESVSGEGVSIILLEVVPAVPIARRRLTVSLRFHARKYQGHTCKALCFSLPSFSVQI